MTRIALPICPPAQYARIEAEAGGVSASRLAILRAARARILPQLRRGRRDREARHNWFRSVLAQHSMSQDLVTMTRL